MMQYGKLVWHFNQRTKSWYVHSHDNDDRMYVIERDYHGGWDVTVRLRFGDEPQELGWHKRLRDAKREADRHHHARILESDDEPLKEYIQRHPLNA